MTSEIIASVHAVITSLLPNELIVKTDNKISLNRFTVPTNNFTTLCFLGLGFFFFSFCFHCGTFGVPSESETSQ